MLDFLFDNPFLLVILLFWLFSAIFGKKKQQQKVAEKPAPPAIQKNEGQPGSRKERRKNRQRELMAKLEQELGSRSPNSARTIMVSEPVPSAPAPVQAPDPYAFHAASGLESRPGPARSEALDYDVSSADYDTPLESASGGGGYEYRPAIDEPEAQEYHLAGFREFQTAHGLSARDRTAAAAAGQAVPRRPSPAVASLFASPDDLRRAFLLQEILGKPKGLRPPGR